MRDRLKKTICVLLCVTLPLGAIAGCKAPPKQVSATATGGISATPAPSATVQPSPTTLKPIDLGGRVVRMYSQLGDHYGIDLKGVALDVLAGQEADVKEQRAKISRVQKAYNCVIKFVGNQTFEDWNKMKTSALAGNPTGDFGEMSTEGVYSGVDLGGAFMDLNKYKEIIQPDNPQLWAVNINRNIFSYDGMQLAVVSRFRGTEAVNGSYVTFFNKSMLKREGLWDKYNLYTLQKDKKWNWSVFQNIAKKVSKDKDGDGQNDQFGMTFDEHLLRALTHTNVTSNSDGGWVNIKDGNAVIALGDSAHKQALAFLTTLYKNGTMPTTDQDKMQLFASGKSAFLIDYGNRFAQIGQHRMMDTWGVVALPLSPNGQKDYITAMDAYFPYVMSYGVKNPEQIAYMMRELIPPIPASVEEEKVQSQALLSNYIRGETQIIDTYEMLAQPQRISTDLDLVFLGNIGIPFWIFIYNVSSVVRGTVSVEQFLQMSMPKIQSSVNDYWVKYQAGAVKMKQK